MLYLLSVCGSDILDVSEISLHKRVTFEDMGGHLV